MGPNSYRFPTPQAAAEPGAPAASLAEPVRFADLPRVMAEAMHADPMARAGARINLEAELAEMVASGRLKVRDSLTRGPHPHPVGAALKDAVLLPQEVRRLLAERGVSLPDVAAPAAPEAPDSASAPAAGLHEAAAVPAPLQRQRYQEGEIFRVLRELGYDPAALPARQPGKPGAKAAAWGLLAQKKWSRGVFDKAWERLRGGGEIVGG